MIGNGFVEMSKLPKIFIGTLYCGENDFEQSKIMIENQKDVIVKHQVISNLKEKEAHNALWKAWREANNGDFDLFVKIDADTVLCHDLILSEIWKVFNSDKEITGLQAPLHDFFTANHINGLNCFAPSVEFANSTDSLFCDRKVDYKHKKVIKSNNVPRQLVPVGYHCHNSNEEQAFHFGVHRALKQQHDIINQVVNAWKIYGDDRRAYAILGALHANVVQSKCNYDDDDFKNLFLKIRSNFDSLKKDL